jgi:hypothetical protein
VAIARLSVGVGKKGKASPHAAYIAREGKYAKPDDDLEKLESVGHGNMPLWAETEPNFFWQMADAYERQNGSAYREHVIALPRELTVDQRHDLVLDWIKQELGDNHAYQYAIHNPPALDGKGQPHCHLMFSERTIDGISRDPDQYFKRYNSKKPEKGGAKKANTGMKPAERKAELIDQRQRWEQICNKHLKQAGSRATINMKSYADRDIKLTPFNLPMNQFNNPKFKRIYLDKLEARKEYQVAVRERKAINVQETIEQITQDNEKAEQVRQAQEAEQVRQAQEAEQVRQAQEAEQVRLAAENAKKARKLDTPTKAPALKLRERLSQEFESLHLRHDDLADNFDSGRLSRNNGRLLCEDFFLATQITLQELNNSICRLPSKHDIAKYEAVYEAVDKLMNSVEQRMENVGLHDVKEHEEATRARNNMRQRIDTNIRRLDMPTQSQPQPTLTITTPRPR